MRELILKRGQTRIGRRRVPLTDNTFIEQHMGEVVELPALFLTRCDAAAEKIKGHRFKDKFNVGVSAWKPLGRRRG